MIRTYTDAEHRALAEFAGWKPGQKCSGRGEGWTVLNSSIVGVPLIVWQSSLLPKIPYSRCIHGMIAEHVILPPPLDDVLAMACLRKLGELNVSPWLDHEDTRPVRWRMHSTESAGFIIAIPPLHGLDAEPFQHFNQVE